MAERRKTVDLSGQKQWNEGREKWTGVNKNTVSWVDEDCGLGGRKSLFGWKKAVGRMDENWVKVEEGSGLDGQKQWAEVDKNWAEEEEGSGLDGRKK